MGPETLPTTQEPADAPNSASEAPPLAIRNPASTAQPNLSANFITPNRPTDADAIRAEASQLAQLVVAQYPRFPDAYEVKARMHLMLGESDRAEQSWESALEIDANYIHAYYGLGEIAVLRNEPEQALSRFEKVKNLDAGYSTDLYYRLSEAQHNLGNIDAAVSILKEAASKDPTSAETQLRLGQEHLAARDYEQAKAAFEKTLELSPALPRAQEGLGRALARLGESARARELLQAQAKAREESPQTMIIEDTFALELTDYAEKYKDIAQVFLARGDSTKAQLILEKSVVLDPQNMATWSSLLGLYQRTNQMAKAKSMSAVMCDANKENAGAFFTSGVIHAKSGDTTKAIELYDRVTELAPESDTGYTALARLLLQTRQQPIRIMELTQRAAELNPSAPNYELLGQAYAVNGKMQEARDSLSKAIDLAPENTAYQQAMQQLDAFLSKQEIPPK